MRNNSSCFLLPSTEYVAKLPPLPGFGANKGQRIQVKHAVVPFPGRPTYCFRRTVDAALHHQVLLHRRRDDRPPTLSCFILGCFACRPTGRLPSDARSEHSSGMKLTVLFPLPAGPRGLHIPPGSPEQESRGTQNSNAVT